MDEIIRLWCEEYKLGIQISSSIRLNTILFADDQVLVANSEDNLQMGVFKLNKIIEECGMKISPEKNKIMAFEGTNPIRSKIVVENVILEQMNSFSYLGCNISYKGENDRLSEKKPESSTENYTALALNGSMENTGKLSIRMEKLQYDNNYNDYGDDDYDYVDDCDDEDNNDESPT
ncbi:hypothetical protein ANN_02405 [Periplaneta americana]|uniref:Reverse transcriptase domain-containing protein n=1 Tax=Periplaneta americana TaxID=6978 RepID=A0ABQ8TWA2_PERAM|nr:hypothetical protein ANN_02405 [Periplaneta americana]